MTDLDSEEEIRSRTTPHFLFQCLSTSAKIKLVFSCMGIDVKGGEEVMVPWAMLESLDRQKFGAWAKASLRADRGNGVHQ